MNEPRKWQKVAEVHCALQGLITGARGYVQADSRVLAHLQGHDHTSEVGLIIEIIIRPLQKRT